MAHSRIRTTGGPAPVHTGSGTRPAQSDSKQAALHGRLGRLGSRGRPVHGAAVQDQAASPPANPIPIVIDPGVSVGVGASPKGAPARLADGVHQADHSGRTRRRRRANTHGDRWAWSWPQSRFAWRCTASGRTRSGQLSIGVLIPWLFWGTFGVSPGKSKTV
jgi:hypothetical protein